MTMVSPDTPLYNSRIFDSYLKLLKKRYPGVSIPELLNHAGMKELEVADHGHWFSQRQVDLFHEKLVQLSGNTGIAREAGRYVASPDALGFLRDFLIGLASPEYGFTLVGKVAANFSRSSRYASRRVGPRELEVTVTFEDGVVENPRQCENRIGFFEGLFLMFGYNNPEIRHDQCVSKGAAFCRYYICWDASSVSRLNLMRRLSFFLLLPLVIFSVSLIRDPLLATVFLGMVLLYLMLVVWTQRTERASLLSSMAGMRSSSEKLLGQIKGRYDSAQMINEIGEVISSRTDLDDIFSSVSQVLCKRLDYGRGVIMLVQSDQSALQLRSCFGLQPRVERTLARLAFPLAAAPQGVLMRCFSSQKPLLVNDLAESAHLLARREMAFLSSLGVQSFICAPIVCEGKCLGILAVDDRKRAGELLQNDLNLIQGVAPVLGIAIRNAMHLANERDLSEQLRRSSEQLERRVQERTQELRRANEELEFLYDSVSHDLRTPLRIIYGYGELLLDGYGGLLDVNARQYLDAMIKGGEQMESTLDRMLDFSGAAVAELKLQPVDLSLMAERILNDLRVTAPKRPVTVRIEEGVVLTGDRELLSSVMENLLGNAWKYSAAKPSSTIAFGMSDGACFVSDQGDGFDMAYADRLFAPFQRLHDRSSFAGHGLGLAMVRRMVERHGGKVWGVGKPGEGATFYFTLS